MNRTTRQLFAALNFIASGFWFVAFSSPKAVASDGPSLQETTDWLSSTMSTYNSEPSLHWQVRFRGCAVEERWSTKATTAETGTGNSVASTTTEIFDLKDFDPTKIRTIRAGEYSTVVLTTTELKKSIQFIKALDNGGETTSSLEFQDLTRFKDLEIATRVATAFKHAVMLCGGKVGSF